MAKAIAVTLEKEIPESVAYVKSKTGKALARELDRLAIAARSKGVESIEALVSQDQEELRKQMVENGFDPSRMRLPPETFFAATEGLRTVRGLADYINARIKDFKQPGPLLRDLAAVEALLVAAGKAGVKFHFSKTEM